MRSGPLKACPVLSPAVWTIPSSLTASRYFLHYLGFYPSLLLSATITPLFQPPSYHSLTLLPGQTSDPLRCRSRATFTPTLRSEPNRHFNGSDVCTPSAERISVIGIEKKVCIPHPASVLPLPSLGASYPISRLASLSIQCFRRCVRQSLAHLTVHTVLKINKRWIAFFSTVAIPAPVPTFKIFFFYAT